MAKWDSFLSLKKFLKNSFFSQNYSDLLSSNHIFTLFQLCRMLEKYLEGQSREKENLFKVKHFETTMYWFCPKDAFVMY